MARALAPLQARGALARQAADRVVEAVVVDGVLAQIHHKMRLLGVGLRDDAVRVRPALAVFPVLLARRLVRRAVAGRLGASS